MNTLPILLVNPRLLLLGGGKVAYQKAAILQDNKISFHVKAIDFSPEFSQITSKKIIGSINQSDLNLYNIIVDATGNAAVGKMLQAEKCRRFLLINRVDNPPECDFYFSSLLNYGALKIAISTNGASPTIGQVVRDKIKQLIPDDLKLLVEDAAKLRQQGIIDPKSIRHAAQLKLAKVYFVGCGTGGVDLLSVKAYRYIRQLDVVIYDQVINAQILALIPDSAQKVYLGHQDKASDFRQLEINRSLLHYAAQGLCVGFLQNGDVKDDFLVSEDLDLLREHGVRVEVAHGLSFTPHTES